MKEIPYEDRKNGKMKRKKYVHVVIVMVAVCVIMAGLCVYWVDGIYRRVSYLREAVISAVEYRDMHRRTVDVTDSVPLKDESDAWYTKYHFIAHAGGGICGRTYTNSLEAWENSYKEGNRVFDADLAFTSDGELVLRHSWNNNLEQTDRSMRESYSFIHANEHVEHLIYGGTVPTYKEFMDMKIYYLYTPMSCEDMIRFMSVHEDLYVACDMKDSVEESYQRLVDTAVGLSAENVLERIIVNLYDYAAYDIIMEIYPFKNVTMRQYEVFPNNYYELADFCLSHDIHVVNVSSCYAEDEGVQMLISKGIHIYVAVADYISDMKDYRALGADGAVTNWLYEKDWKYIEEF